MTPSAGDIAFASGAELGPMLAAGRLRASDILEVNLDQIRRHDGTLHAFIAVDEAGARRAAAAIDAEIARDGWRGGVHGLTVAVKDVLDVAGLPTTHGARAFLDAPPAAADCDAVARLRKAGAVILGKTNTPPYASYINTRSIQAGTTVSPWNPALSSGGSSGGSAVAVAAGMSVLALGTDLGGSVRGPAAWNGCYGLRPTAGRIANAPHGWVDDSMDVIGIIARAPEDVRAGLAAAEARQPADADGHARPTARFAFTADFDGRLVLAREVRSAFDRAVDAIAAAGFDLVPRSPVIDDALAAIRPLRALRALVTFPDPPPPRLDEDNPLLAEFLRRARSMGLADIVAGADARTAAWRANDRFFDDVDALILPATQFIGLRADQEWPEIIDGTPVPDVLAACSATYAITILGWPALAVPCGLAENGLPVGIQMVAPRGGEARLLDLAVLLRERLGWTAIRPPFASGGRR